MTGVTPKRRPELFYPIVCGVFGVFLIASGYRARQTGYVFPQTPKHGPMTGSQPMAVGALWCAGAGLWAWFAVRNTDKGP
jgi:hypothetical protein